MKNLTRMLSLLSAAIVALALVGNAYAERVEVVEKAGGEAVEAVEAVAGELLNINTADEKALTKLKGVGPATAKKIVAYREANGPFTKLEDLTKVKGIGKKTIAKWEGKLSFEVPGAAAEEAEEAEEVEKE